MVLLLNLIRYFSIQFDLVSPLLFGQVVVLIGSAASAVDISLEIAGVAREVHIAARSVGDDKLGKLLGFENMWLHSMVKLVIYGENWMAVMAISQFISLMLLGMVDWNGVKQCRLTASMKMEEWFSKMEIQFVLTSFYTALGIF